MNLAKRPWWAYFKQNSIRRRLFRCFISLVVLPLLLLGTISYFIATNALEKNIILSSDRALNQIVLHLELYLRQYRQASLSALGNQLARDFLTQPQFSRGQLQETPQIRQIRTYLFDPIYTGNNEIEGIYLANYQSRVFGITKQSGDLFLDNDSRYGDRLPWINVLPRDGSMLVSGIHPSFINSNKPVITLARKIFPPGMPEQPLGAFWIDLNLQRIQEICEQIQLGKSGYIAISDAAGKVIFHPQTNYIGNPFPHGLFQRISATASGHFLTTIADERSLVIFNTASDTKWRVVAVVPYSEIGSEVLRLRSITTLMILLCVIASVILSITFAASITKPIDKLQKSMEEASQGFLNLAVPVESTDEIGKLTYNFNQMLTKIKTLVVDNYQAKLRESAAEVKQHQAEVRALQAQINPHFLYNTLGTISSLAELQGVESISQMAGALSDFFRYSIHTDEMSVTLRDELAQVNRYFIIQKLRFGDRIDLTIELPDHLMDHPIIKLTLQPLVENACIHGLELYGCGRITIRSQEYWDHLVILVTDDGAGIPQERLAAIQSLLDHPDKDKGEIKLGIGLRNVHSRLKLHYGEEYGIQIRSAEGKGTTVAVLLPKSNNPE